MEEKLSETAYRTFKKLLFARKVAPGQFISQRQLVDLVGVSLAPVREALQRLEAEGFIQIVSRRGIQVVDASMKRIRNCYQVRLAIEKEAVQKFADTAPDDVLTDLVARHRAILAKAEQGIDRRLLAAAHEVDQGLHSTIVRALDNDLLSGIYETNNDRIRIVRFEHGLRMTPPLLRSAMEDHLAILDACVRREPVAAMAAMDRHINVALRRALGV